MRTASSPAAPYAQRSIVRGHTRVTSPQQHVLGKQRKGEDIREVDQDPEAESSEEDYEPISLLLAKQRNGPTGRINLAFRRKYTRFEILEGEPRLN